MALLASTSLSAEGRSKKTLEEHEVIVRAIESGDAEGADAALREHISRAFMTRLRLDAANLQAAR
jgi:DNA-binding GntR family transcriptional regulator